MNRRLITVIITGLIIESLCVAISFIGDIKKNIPCFAIFYTAFFITYIFAVFYVSKNAELSEDNGNEITQYQVAKLTKGNSGSLPFAPPCEGGAKGEALKSDSTPLVTKQRNDNNSGKIFWSILIFSFMFRLTLLPMAPSDDVNRYLWEGKLQLNGINPYSHPPESSNLEPLRDRFFSGINHKHLSTIYPPLTLMVFALADFVSPSVLSMKSAFLIFDLLTIFVLLRLLSVTGKDPLHVLTYAWSPLVLISFAARGHCDSLQIFLVVLALYLYVVRKNLRSVFSIALAAMSKFIFIIIAPFLIPAKKLRYIIVLFSVIVVLYLPYVSAGKGLFSTLFHFGTQYHFNDSAHFLIFCLCIGSPMTSKIVTALIFGSVLLFLYKKYLNVFVTDDNGNPTLLLSSEKEGEKRGNMERDNFVLHYAFVAIGTFLILTPTLHPWYLTWIVPFLCFHKNRAWLVLTGTVVCYYFMNHDLFSEMILYNNEWVWKEVHWLKLPEYVPFYGLLIYGWLQARGKKIATENAEDEDKGKLVYSSGSENNPEFL